LKQLLEGVPEVTPIVPLSKSTAETRVPVTNFASEIANAVWCGISTTFLTLNNATSSAEKVAPISKPLPLQVTLSQQNNRQTSRRQLTTSKVSPEVVFFCRRVYDYRQKRMIKNPS